MFGTLTCVLTAPCVYFPHDNTDFIVYFPYILLLNILQAERIL